MGLESGQVEGRAICSESDVDSIVASTSCFLLHSLKVDDEKHRCNDTPLFHPGGYWEAFSSVFIYSDCSKHVRMQRFQDVHDFYRNSSFTEDSP